MKNNSQLLMPREKMLKFGISALTDVELLALFLRTGTRGKDVLTLAKEMLENFGSLYGLLTSEYEQFSGVHGIGVAKFAQLKGIAELARRYYNVRMREESPLLSPEMTREFLQSQLTGEEREIFMVTFLFVKIFRGMVKDRVKNSPQKPNTIQAHLILQLRQLLI